MLYHVVHREFRNDIREHGLDPANYETRLLWTFAYLPDTSDQFDVWAINTTGLEPIPGDELSAEWSIDDPVFAFADRIPPEALTLIEGGNMNTYEVTLVIDADSDHDVEREIGKIIDDYEWHTGRGMVATYKRRTS